MNAPLCRALMTRMRYVWTVSICKHTSFSFDSFIAVGGFAMCTWYVWTRRIIVYLCGHEA